MTYFKRWLIDNDIKQKQIAKDLGLSLGNTNKKINGKRYFTLQQVFTICKKYGVSADIFIKDLDQAATATTK